MKRGKALRKKKELTKEKKEEEELKKILLDMQKVIDAEESVF